jgi:hypothetical protein
VTIEAEWVGDFTNPILKPEAAEVVKQHGELSKKKIDRMRCPDARASAGSGGVGNGCTNLCGCTIATRFGG